MATADGKWLSRMPRGRARFLVEVHGTDDAHKATRARVSEHTTTKGAFGAVVEVIRQWTASEGAVRPGSTIVITDMNDGGRLFEATYLGFEPTLL